MSAGSQHTCGIATSGDAYCQVRHTPPTKRDHCLQGLP
ncbi:RCC1 domain-containing protein [Gemmatimonadota bacterium]